MLVLPPLPAASSLLHHTWAAAVAATYSATQPAQWTLWYDEASISSPIGQASERRSRITCELLMRLHERSVGGNTA
jgi:hypothetical protein